MIRLALALSLIASPALAQPPCADHADVVTRLETLFGETRRSFALSGGGIVETFASDETGTWTIIVTLPNGLSCLLAAGEAYETVTPIKGDPA